MVQYRPGPARWRDAAPSAPRAESREPRAESREPRAETSSTCQRWRLSVPTLRVVLQPHRSFLHLPALSARIKCRGTRRPRPSRVLVNLRGFCAAAGTHEATRSATSTRSATPTASFTSARPAGTSRTTAGLPTTCRSTPRRQGSGRQRRQDGHLPTEGDLAEGRADRTPAPRRVKEPSRAVSSHKGVVDSNRPCRRSRGDCGPRSDDLGPRQLVRLSCSPGRSMRRNATTGPPRGRPEDGGGPQVSRPGGPAGTARHHWSGSPVATSPIRSSSIFAPSIRATAERSPRNTCL